MNITGFIWLDDIVEKMEVKHHVEQDEVRELFASLSFGGLPGWSRSRRRPRRDTPW